MKQFIKLSLSSTQLLTHRCLRRLSPCFALTCWLRWRLGSWLWLHAMAPDDVHTVRDIDPNETTNMRVLLAFERTQAALQSVCLDDVAPRNIPPILVTLDTSHFDMSPGPWREPGDRRTASTTHTHKTKQNKKAKQTKPNNNNNKKRKMQKKKIVRENKNT